MGPAHTEVSDWTFAALASHPSFVKRCTDIYGGSDPADVPAYPLAEAALLVGVPASTLRNWTRGRSFSTKRGRQTSTRVIHTPEVHFLSFTNIVEAHVLASLRKEYRISLDKIRDAVRYVERHFEVEHALARKVFKTDGVDLFIDRLGGALLNASRYGQTALRAVIEDHLKRVEYQKGRAVRFFPLHRQGAPRLVVVDPRRAFGRPTLAGTSVPIGDIKARFQAGDDVDELAADFRVPVSHIQEALRASPAEAA